MALAQPQRDPTNGAQIALGSIGRVGAKARRRRGGPVGPVDESPNPRLGPVPRALGVLGTADWTGLTLHTTPSHRQEAARA